jgi:glutathione synthase/RimK-type ligase-like ATP-grasp enzyme
VDLVQANLDKIYLLEFQDQGIRVPRTVLLDRNSEESLAEVLDQEGWKRAVVKPRVSGAAYETWRVRREDAVEESDRFLRARRARDLMIQEYLPEIETDGERSFVFLGGRFSHAVRKRPRPGDFRVQSRHGGTNEALVVPSDQLDQARAVLELLPSTPCYARVDAILHQGSLLVMELELIEPNLFLGLHPGAADRFAGVITGWLGADRRPAEITELRPGLPA